jgi:uncharacterized membrane protein
MAESQKLVPVRPALFVVVLLTLMAPPRLDAWGQEHQLVPVRRPIPPFRVPYSQPPSPSASDFDQPAQQKSGSAQKTSEADQRNASNVSTSVDATPTENAEQKAQHAERERAEKAAADWWIVRLTGILAFIGFLQFLVFSWQGWQLKRSVNVAKAAAEALPILERDNA